MRKRLAGLTHNRSGRHVTRDTRTRASLEHELEHAHGLALESRARLRCDAQRRAKPLNPKASGGGLYAEVKREAREADDVIPGRVVLGLVHGLPAEQVVPAE